jgi:hypothetical protein
LTDPLAHRALPRPRPKPLHTRSPEDLARARSHHRRALRALEAGGFDALETGTRQALIRRLKSDLDALDEALDRHANGG